MKFKVSLLSFALICSSLLVVNGAFAQGCKAELMNGPGGGIIDIFRGPNCNAASTQCNNRLRQLRSQDPYFYQNAYCNVAPPPHITPPPGPNPQPVPPPSYVTRAYDRCQAPGVVRCTQEWSDGKVVTEDHPCPGCQGYGNPAGDPCGWRCSFPQQ